MNKESEDLKIGVMAGSVMATVMFSTAGHHFEPEWVASEKSLRMNHNSPILYIKKSVMNSERRRVDPRNKKNQAHESLTMVTNLLFGDTIDRIPKLIRSPFIKRWTVIRAGA